MALTADDLKRLITTRMRKITSVDLPTVGGTVHVRELAISELMDWEDLEAKRNVVEMLSRVLSDASGNRLYSNGNAQFLDQLPLLDCRVIIDAAKEINGITDADVAAAKAAQKKIPSVS